MKKGLLIFSIILWTIIAIAIVGLIIFGLNGGFNHMINTGTLIKSENVSLSNIQNIVVDASSQTVEIHKISGNSIKISQYGSTKTSNERLFLISASEDAVHIYFNSNHNFSLFDFNISEKLVIEIPEEFTGDLDAKASSGNVKIEDDFKLKNALLQSQSGNISIVRNLTAGSLNAETSSGDINSHMNITVDEEVVLKCSSGNINLDGDLAARDLNARTNSGRIRLGNVNVEKYSLQSSSGNIKAESISGGGEAEASSGDIQLSLKNPKGNVKLTSNSGSIRIVLEPSLQFTLAAQTNSGGIHTNFATMSNGKNNKATAKIGDNPTVSIIAQASSGGIRIER